MEGGHASVIRLCGPLEVEIAGRRVEAGLPGRQGRLLFAYLVHNRARALPRSELLDVLWGDDPPLTADGALSALLSKLRKTLGPEALPGRADVRLALPQPVYVDVEEAEAAAARAETALRAGDAADAAAAARAALAVDAQAFLPDCDDEWTAERREVLESLHVRALETLGNAALRQGGPELAAAEQAARAAVAAAPYRESAYRLLMEVHEAAGNHAEALRVFDDLRTRLRAELGAAPGPETIEVFERLLRGERLAAAPAEPERATWPPALSFALGRHPLIGRDEDLRCLESCWREAVTGIRMLVAVTGEAGIGKTHLMAELARRVHEDGAVVLYGRFDEETVAPYKPLLEMVRGWAGGHGLGPVAERLDAQAARELALLLPELGAPPAPSHGDAEAARLRLFDAVSELLAAIAQHSPLLVVVDDLQWGDRSTLQLLRHLVTSPEPRRCMFLGAYSEAAPLAAPALAELLEDLRRASALTRRELGGLAPDGVAELVEALGPGRSTEDFIETLHGETEGNPFFIEEMVRHLDEAGEAGGIPEGIREVTARRLARLDESTRAVLGIAATIGREFDFDVLERLAPVQGDELIGALEEAAAARLLREVEVGRWSFRHVLLRDALLENLSALRRARLHRAVAEALIELRADDLDPCLATIAHHFEQAAPAGAAEAAIEYALAAARRADDLLAWEEAAEHYRAALRVLGHTDERRRCELLLALGTSLHRAGLDSARETFAEAVALARSLADETLLARTALGFAGPWSTLARVDDDVVDLLEEALAELGEEDSPLRARVLSRLSLELYYCGFPERRLELSEEAVAIARRLGDPRTLAIAFDARHYALWRPETVQERLQVAGELRELAVATGDPELELEGAGWTVVDLLELGDVRGADIQVAAAATLADKLRRPLYQWWTAVMRATLAQLRGDLPEAEQLAAAALAVGQRGLPEQAVHYYAMNMFQTRREQGRLREAVEPVRRFIAMYPAIPAWRGVLALSHVELGEHEAAREVFEAVAADGFDALPLDANWLIAVTVLAEVCGALADAERARELYAMLEPYASRNVVVGRAASCNGSAARPLGILAATLGDHERADRHFAHAVAQHRAMGARPWSARTRVAWAEALLRRDDGRERARELLEEALASAEPIGLAATAQRARDTLATLSLQEAR